MKKSDLAGRALAGDVHARFGHALLIVIHAHTSRAKFLRGENREARISAAQVIDDIARGDARQGQHALRDVDRQVRQMRGELVGRQLLWPLRGCLRANGEA